MKKNHAPVRCDFTPVIEVLVERDDPQAVERGNQDESHNQLPHREARDHLHVGKRVGGDRTGDRNEGHARHRGADHGESRHVPRGAAVAGEEAGVVGTAARGPCDGEKDGYVAQDGGGNGGRSHNLYLGSNYKGIKKTDTKAGKRGFYKPENRMRKIVCRIGFPEKTVIFATNYTSNP